MGIDNNGLHGMLPHRKNVCIDLQLRRWDLTYSYQLKGVITFASYSPSFLTALTVLQEFIAKS